MFVNGYYPYLALKNQQNPSLNVYNLPLTVAFVNSMLSPSSPTYSHPYLDATDSDLSGFNAHNGKLVLYHGWGDQHITPQGTLEYWQAVRDKVGASTVEEFIKLYLFPGMAHCGGGNGPNTFDLLTPVMSWVETATKPSTVIASNPATATSRPVFPYPLAARYTGSGDTTSAANFNAYVPMTQAPANYNWVGDSIYSNTNYEQTCTVQNGQLVCQPGRQHLPNQRTGTRTKRGGGREAVVGQQGIDLLADTLGHGGQQEIVAGELVDRDAFGGEERMLAARQDRQRFGP